MWVKTNFDEWYQVHQFYNDTCESKWPENGWQRGYKLIDNLNPLFKILYLNVNSQKAYVAIEPTTKNIGIATHWNYTTFSKNTCEYITNLQNGK